MDALSKISSRVGEFTRRSKATRLQDSDSFTPPTYECDPSPSTAVNTMPDYGRGTSANKYVERLESENVPQHRNARSIIPASIRRFSPFPARLSRESLSPTEDDETSNKEKKLDKEQKESKYRRMNSTEGEKNANGMRKFKDTALGRVDRMRKERQGEYGEQLLKEDLE